MVRREVFAFAEAMEARLKDNDYKGGWGEDNFCMMLYHRHLNNESCCG